MTDKTDKTPQSPPSLRDAIQSAVDTEKERIAAETKEIKEPKEIKSEETDTKAANKDELKEPLKKEEAKEEVKEDKKEEKEEPETKAADKKAEKVEVKTEEKKEETEPKKEIKVPFGVPKNIREKFASLDEETRDYISKLTKESHDAKSLEGRKAYIRDIDQVLEPYQQAIRNIGSSPAAVIKRLLEYTDALSSPQHQEMAIVQLAQDFKIDLVKVVDDIVARNQNSTGNTNETVPAQIPPEITQKINSLSAELDAMKQAKTTDNDKAAEESVNTWAGFDPVSGEYKTKPYFPYVRKLMHSVIANGTVPLVNGRIDLDAAYDAACYAHPEIRELIIEEQTKAREAALREKQQQRITKAKDAGVSVRPGAPVQRTPVQQKKTGPQPFVPAGQSLREAIRELRENGRA